VILWRGALGQGALNHLTHFTTSQTRFFIFVFGHRYRFRRGFHRHRFGRRRRGRFRFSFRLRFGRRNLFRRKKLRKLRVEAIILFGGMNKNYIG